MDRLNQNGMHPCSFGTPDIGKELIPHKQAIFFGAAHHLHCLPIIFRGWFVGIFDVFPSDGIRKRFHTRKLIVGNQTVIHAKLPQMCKQGFCFLICRCSVRNQCIVDIKEYSPIAFLCQFGKINAVC